MGNGLGNGVDVSDTTDAATGTNKKIKAKKIAPIIVRKTASEIVNNSTVLQDDNHLTLPVAAIWQGTG